MILEYTIRYKIPPTTFSQKMIESGKNVLTMKYSGLWIAILGSSGLASYRVSFPCNEEIFSMMAEANIASDSIGAVAS